MIWMSLHNWSLIAAKKYIGVGNFIKAWHDPQFWSSLGFTLKYTAADHADTDDPRLPDRAADRHEHATQKIHARRCLRAGGHRPRRVEPALVLALQLRFRPGQPVFDRPRRRSRNPWCGSARTPTSPCGRSSFRSSGKWSASARSCSSRQIHGSAGRRSGEAAMVDGASYWQRVRRIILPLDRLRPSCWSRW